MLRSLLIFLGSFAGGALIALIVRAALFDPHAERTPHTDTGSGYSAMVQNPLTPANATAPVTETPSPSKAAPAHHAAAATSAADQGTQPVNTICAICGMPVDPSLPTVEYEGRTVGFGCRMCPPKFKANPDKYGPAYLKNELYRP